MPCFGPFGLILGVQDGATAKVAVAVATAVRPRVLQPDPVPARVQYSSRNRRSYQDNPGRRTSEQLSKATNKTQPFKIEPPIPQAHAQFQAQMASRSTVHRRNGSSKSSQQHNYSLIPSISKLKSFGHHYANLENTSCLGVTLRSVS